MHPKGTRIIVLHFVKNSLLTNSARLCCTCPQKFIKVDPVDHAHKTIVDVNVDLVVCRRNHAGAIDFGHQQMVWNFKVFDQSGRYGATTRLGPALSV